MEVGLAHTFLGMPLRFAELLNRMVQALLQARLSLNRFRYFYLVDSTSFNSDMNMFKLNLQNSARDNMNFHLRVRIKTN